MADREATATPVIDILQRGDELLIRTEADVRPEDVRVDVHDGLLEVHVPLSALTPARVARPRQVEEQRPRAGTGQPARALGGRREEREKAHPSGQPGAEPPLGVPDERDMWDRQRPLISEDRRTSIHLEGFTDEQANEVLEVLGDDAPEEAQGGSATGSGVYPDHGGFPSRAPEEEGESS